MQYNDGNKKEKLKEEKDIARGFYQVSEIITMLGEKRNGVEYAHTWLNTRKHCSEEAGKVVKMRKWKAKVS